MSTSAPFNSLSVPEVDDAIGSHYLRGALQRSNYGNLHFEDVNVVEVGGGRSGAKLKRITTDTGISFVVKSFKRSAWKKEIFGYDASELDLWVDGKLKEIRKPLANATIDISYNPDNLEWRLLMLDVAPFFKSRNGMIEILRSSFVEGITNFHINNMSRYEKIPSRVNVFRFFHDPIKSICNRLDKKEWHLDLIKSWNLETSMSSVFDIIGSEGFDRYFSMCGAVESLCQREDIPSTILNGDIKNEHIALKYDSEIYLIDWNFPYTGPPTDDIAYFWFLSFWCIPYGDRLGPGSVETFRVNYLKHLHLALNGDVGYATVERSWGISWLKTFLQMPWCIVHSSSSKLDIDRRLWRSDLLRAAWMNAQRTAEKYL